MNTPHDILYKSEAYLNIKRFKIFKNSILIYEANYNELLKSFYRHEKLNLAELLDKPNGRKILYKHHDKISSHLFNYLASTFSLIRATSVYYNECFKPKDLIIEYDNKIKKEVNSQAVKKFIDDLRNYIQHKEIPDIVTQTVFEANPSIDFKSYIKFQTEDLLKYKKWSKLSKEYIKDNAKSLIIPKAVNDFHLIFKSFTDWFIQQVEDCLQDDRNKVEKLRLKMNTEFVKLNVHWYFEFGDQNISGFEKTFLPKFTKWEKIVIKREKNRGRRVVKILSTIKKYVNINKDFEARVTDLYK
ncbi:MAG: hypothetical protein IMY72_04120 [Bacteroidetes bacterium]|nr:hypothetical protein [Bacteroidota bacterium]